MLSRSLRNVLPYPLIFLASAIWFSTAISWKSLIDPDAFYHARAAMLLWQNGPLHAFPWLDLTTLGRNFADHHFLFHVFEAPFVHFLGWIIGVRVVAVFLLSLFITVLYFCLKKLNVSHPWIWALLVATSHPIIVRGLLGKASPLAITLFTAGLTAAWLRKPWIVYVITCIFALSHGGWVFLIGAIFFLAIGDVLFRWVVMGERASLKLAPTSTIRMIPASILGAATGLLLHPNRDGIFSFLWIQVVKIGLGTPWEHVRLGNEWSSPPLSTVIIFLGPWLIALLLGLAGILFAIRKPLDQKRAHAVVAFALPVAIFLALTFKSRRNIEYLVPTLALWIPWIWSLIDIKRFFKELYRTFPHAWRTPIAIALIIICLLPFGKGIYEGYRDLHTPRYLNNAYETVFAPIQANAKSGDRVFHTDWDEFPILFLRDDRLRYISGLDPTFLYEASSTLSDSYRDLVNFSATPTQTEIWNLIHDRLESNWIFATIPDHARFVAALKTDPRYHVLAETENAVSFSVEP